MNFRPPGGPKWPSGGLWRPPGASWAGGEAQEGGLGGKGSLLFFFETATKLVLELLGSILGTSWRLLGRFWVLPSPPGGGPERLREVIFGGFVRPAAREAKNREKS